MEQVIAKAQTLIEALPYIQKFNGKKIVVKYGGSAMLDEGLKYNVIKDVALLKLVGLKPIIVHGGGKEISKWVEMIGKEPEFINGLRVTDKETMEIAEMVLSKVNKGLVQMMQKLGVNAVGISGKDAGLMTVTKKFPGGKDIGYVGEVKCVNSGILDTLIDNDFIPVIAPIGSSEESYYVETGDKISPGNNTKVQAHKVGYAARSFYVYQQVYDENGKPIENMFVDRNGDGIINSADKYIYKDPAPDVTMGLTSKMLYKNWDFSFALRASFNNYVYYNFLADKARVNGSYLASNNAYHNNSAESAALGFTGLGEYYMSDYFVRNASFLRCDNITLGYSFKDLFKGNGERGIGGRIYATVQNPFIISKYKGLDPEVSSGVDNNPYPRATTFLLGVNLQF